MVGCVLKFRRFCKFLLCAGMVCGLLRIRILTFCGKNALESSTWNYWILMNLMNFHKFWTTCLRLYSLLKVSLAGRQLCETSNGLPGRPHNCDPCNLLRDYLCELPCLALYGSSLEVPVSTCDWPGRPNEGRIGLHVRPYLWWSNVWTMFRSEAGRANSNYRMVSCEAPWFTRMRTLYLFPI